MPLTFPQPLVLLPLAVHRSGRPDEEASGPQHAVDLQQQHAPVAVPVHAAARAVHGVKPQRGDGQPLRTKHSEDSQQATLEGELDLRGREGGERGGEREGKRYKRG